VGRPSACEADCRIGQACDVHPLDNTNVALPFCNVLTMRSDLVSRSQIFIDPPPLFA